MRFSMIAPLGFAVALAATATAQMTGATGGTASEKIMNAMRAGPHQVTTKATIMDWPAVRGGTPVQLRAGTNGWICYPRSSKVVDNAMCFDPVFQLWFDAIRAKASPRITRIGIAYLLAGGFIGSARSPFETAQTSTNDWGRDGPSMMVISPDPSLYAGLPTRRSEGPYVMYAGTPYAHIMVPIGAPGPGSKQAAEKPR